MRKLIIMVILITVQGIATQAQKTSDPAKADIKTAPVMQAPVKTQAPRTKTAGETPPAAATQNSSNFYLTSAKVTIYTGNDNKEQPSQAQVMLVLGANGISSNWERKEFVANSATEMIIKPYYSRDYYPEKLRLVNVETGGVKLMISYSPNFLLDAWKIEKVILTLEFRDDNGNLHPVMGTKNINFVNLGALLNDGTKSLTCEADRFMMPAKTYVGK